MNTEERQFEAEALVRLTQSNDGKVFLRILQTDFDEAMRLLLHCKGDEVLSRQGAAQAYSKTLQRFTDAQKHMNAKRG